MAYREYEQNGQLKRTRNQGYRYSHDDVGYGIGDTPRDKHLAEEAMQNLRDALGRDLYVQWFEETFEVNGAMGNFTWAQMKEKAEERISKMEA